MSYNCHYPILAATQCPALVTSGDTGDKCECGPGALTTHRCLQHKSHSSSAANQLNVQSNGDSPQRCECDWDNEMMGEGQGEPRRYLHCLRQNQMWSNSSHSSHRQKWNSKIFTKCQNQTWEDVIQTLGRNEEKQSAPSVKRGIIVKIQTLPVMTFQDPKLNISIKDCWKERLLLVFWNDSLCQFWDVGVGRSRSHAVHVPGVPRGRFTTGNLQLFMSRSLGRDNGNIWTLNTHEETEESPQPGAVTRTCFIN